MDDEVNKPINDEESTKFLKLIKYHDYNVVDQLKKPSSYIPTLSHLEFETTLKNDLKDFK
jgi:hypothetical protein